MTIHMREFRAIVYVACRKDYGQDFTTMGDTIESCQILVDECNDAEPEWATQHPVFEIIPIVETFLIEV